MSLIQLNVGDELFSIFSKLSNNHLQQLSQSITPLCQSYLWRFLGFYSIKPKPEPP